MPENNLLNIDNILINKEILKVKFSCDLSKCKGACCTLESEYGAPLQKSEIKPMTDALPFVMEYLPEEHAREIESGGFFEKKDGELVTRSLNSRACVFVYYENNIARCAFEKAYLEGKISFRKPISCHLFPIRVSDFGGDVLRYERFSECSPALEEGKNTGLTIGEFCKDSLVRKYGENWYNKLENEIKK